MSNVETFSLVDHTWLDAPDFCDKGKCFQFLGAQGVTASLTAFLFGGNDVADEAGYSNAIFELTCPNEERKLCGEYFTLTRKILLCPINWGTQWTMEIGSNE
jgi:hypothetical protein